MTTRSYARENDELLEHIHTVCSSMEQNEIRENDLYFPRWQLSVKSDIQSLDPMGKVICNFILDCPRFDEPVREQVAGFGSNLDQAIGSAAASFLFGMMAAVITMMRKESVLQLTTDFAGQERKWNCIQSEIMGMGQTLSGDHRFDFWNTLKGLFPQVLGSRKVTVIKASGARQADGRCDCRVLVNNEPCSTLTDALTQTIKKWDNTDYVSRSQIFILEQDPAHSHIYPYSYEQIRSATHQAMRLFMACDSADKLNRYVDILSKDLKDQTLAELMRCFLPEICAENAFSQVHINEQIRFQTPSRLITVNRFQITPLNWIRDAVYEGFRNEDYDTELFHKMISLSSLYASVNQWKAEGKDLKDQKAALFFVVSDQFKLC